MRHAERQYNDSVIYDYHTKELPGCCGVQVVYGLTVYNRDNTVINRENYESLNHIDFIKHVEGSIIDTAERSGYTRVQVTDVVPDKIKNLNDAYWTISARHNNAINLYTVFNDLGWKRMGKKFRNKRTGNTVATFYKDI